jgi:hypothetical protein
MMDELQGRDEGGAEARGGRGEGGREWITTSRSALNPPWLAPRVLEYCPNNFRWRLGELQGHG